MNSLFITNPELTIAVVTPAPDLPALSQDTSVTHPRADLHRVIDTINGCGDQPPLGGPIANHGKDILPPAIRLARGVQRA